MNNIPFYVGMYVRLFFKELPCCCVCARSMFLYILHRGQHATCRSHVHKHAGEKYQWRSLVRYIVHSTLSSITLSNSIEENNHEFGASSPEYRDLTAMPIIKGLMCKLVTK